MKSYNVKNLKPVIMQFAATLPPVDCSSGPLKNRMVDIIGRIGSFKAIDKDDKVHSVYYVGNWAGRIYLGSTTHKVYLDDIEIIYQDK